MYRSDKQFMKNPATAACRIYIGNLAETVVPDNLEERFGSHGKILGLVLQRGFGFIQFENESEAQSAINKEHNAIFCGRKLNVKQAMDGTKAKGSPAQPFNNQNKFPNNQNREQGNFQNNQNRDQNNSANNQNNFQNKQNRNQNTPQNRDHNELPMKSEGFIPKHIQPLLNTPAMPQNHENLPDHPKSITPQAKGPLLPGKPQPLMGDMVQPPIDREMDNRDDGPPEKRNNRMRGRDKQRGPKRTFRDEPFYDNRDNRENVPYNPNKNNSNFVRQPIIDRPERNDCEIIVVSKALTEYSEFVEQKLKSLGLIVDLLFPNEDVPIGRVLANISSRGCLYAILIMPQNEEHRSITMNILHGVPEEHRNMPIEDAMILIMRNFHSYMRGEQLGGSGPDKDKMTLITRHPEHIQVILNLVAENRQIITTQYDKLLGYLQEKRELQSQFEIKEGIDTGKEPESKTKQAELQSRIMNILNKKPEDIPPEIPEPVVVSNAPTPLLNDPSVQKALDSLLSGEMFKSIAS